jgi:hypothetical protein
MLRAAEIAGMKAAQEAHMADSFTIGRKTFTQSETGGRTPTSETLGPYTGRLRHLSGSERLTADAVRTQADAKLYYPTSVEVQQQDAISHNGTTYEVVELLPMTAWTTAGEALLKRV